MIRIKPKKYISERFILDFVDFTKQQAIKEYKRIFPQFKLNQLDIEL